MNASNYFFRNSRSFVLCLCLSAIGFLGLEKIDPMLTIFPQPVLAQVIPGEPKSPTPGGPTQVSTEEIDQAICDLVQLMEGYLGALLAVVAGVGAIVAAAFGAFRSAWSLMIVSIASFVIRTMTLVWFDVEKLKGDGCEDGLKVAQANSGQNSNGGAGGGSGGGSGGSGLNARRANSTDIDDNTPEYSFGENPTPDGTQQAAPSIATPSFFGSGT